MKTFVTLDVNGLMNLITPGRHDDSDPLCSSRADSTSGLESCPVDVRLAFFHQSQDENPYEIANDNEAKKR